MKILRTIVLLFLWAASASAKPPNIIFILADDQAWNGTSVPMIPGDHSRRNRAFQTPNIERLAAQGVTFSQAYAAHCKCECSRASIQMGRTTTTLNAPDKTGRNWSAPVIDSIVNTLVIYTSDNGGRTGILQGGRATSTRAGSGGRSRTSAVGDPQRRFQTSLLLGHPRIPTLRRRS